VSTRIGEPPFATRYHASGSDRWQIDRPIDDLELALLALELRNKWGADAFARILDTLEREGGIR
jgi:hypothetical protein